MLRDQHVALGLRFHQLLLQLGQRALQVLHLRFLIFHLLPEALGRRAVGHRALHRGARQLVVVLVEGHIRAPHPLPVVVFVFLEFLLQHMLVGDRNRHLGLHLEQLILHIEDHLLDHFFRVLGLVDQIVEVGPNQCGNAL